MNIAAPAPFEEALAILREKRLVPTELSSAELRDIASEVKAQAIFSARLTQLRPLQALQEVLDAMLSGEINLAEATLELGRVYAEMGYDSEAGGFPQDAPGTVPGAARGSLRDLASEKRKRFTIQTNYRMAANAAFTKAGTTEMRLWQFPAWELVRIGARRTPRGFQRRKGSLRPLPGDDWNSRWLAAGGELFENGTRMIALKTSDVWRKLGEGAGGYKDTLGNPYAPFAFGSGYGLREVAREDALLIGVLEPFTQDVDLKKKLTREDGKPGQLPLAFADALARQQDDPELAKIMSGIAADLRRKSPPMRLEADARQFSPETLAVFKDLDRHAATQTVSLSERARERAREAARQYQLKNRCRSLLDLLKRKSHV